MTTMASSDRGSTWTRWGGGALLAGMVVFIGSRFRHLIDPSDRILTIMLPLGFVLLLVGVVALAVRYRGAHPLGDTGLALIVGGMVLLTVGHVGGFLVGLPGPWFLPIVVGTLVLVLGALSFGVPAARGEVLPRWGFAPLLTGVIGVLWIVFAFDARPDGGNPTAFVTMRTLFGLGWLPIAWVLMTDRDPVTVPLRSRHGRLPPSARTDPQPAGGRRGRRDHRT